MEGNLSHLSPPHSFSYVTKFVWLPTRENEQSVIVTLTNVQIEDVSIFKEASNEKIMLLFQQCKVSGKRAIASNWYAWCRDTYQSINQTVFPYYIQYTKNINMINIYKNEAYATKNKNNKDKGQILRSNR